jgi:hypothetical protein
MQQTTFYCMNTQKSPNSQFPLWDFFECNKITHPCFLGNCPHTSQFPLWDFFECNKKEKPQMLIMLTDGSQFPLWDFFECNRCRFGCFSGDWRGKSAGHTAYPAPATALIKIRTLFKFISVKPSPTHPHTFHRGLPRGRKPSAMQRT